MDTKQYYSVTTRRFTLRSNHDDWLKMTQDLYNEVLLFYYQLFFDIELSQPDSLLLLSNQQILRKLETLTIVGRDKKPVIYPLPWIKIPLYFRRAAINGAISSAKSYVEKIKGGRNVGKAQEFKNGITFYKGTYQDMTAENITLKVWNGESWQWIRCRLSGNFIPDHAQPLSPTILCDGQETALFLPVKIQVHDGRKAKERMQQEVGVCSIQFTNKDYFAVGVVMDGSGKPGRVKFFKGGREYSARCADIVDKIRRSEKSMGVDKADNSKTIRQTHEKLNCKYWMKLKHISNYYAHFISKQLIQFCIENEVRVIILPKYDEKFTKYVMFQSGNWSPVHLSVKIRELLSYKAWQAGLIILEVNPSGTSGICEKCGAPIKRKNDTFHCPNGHQGNKFINSAINLGKKCLGSFMKEKRDAM